MFLGTDVIARPRTASDYTDNVTVSDRATRYKWIGSLLQEIVDSDIYIYIYTYICSFVYIDTYVYILYLRLIDMIKLRSLKPPTLSVESLFHLSL